MSIQFWANHPNAECIGRVLISVSTFPNIWSAGHEEASTPEWKEAIAACGDSVSFARDINGRMFWSSANEAIVALLSFENCGHMLDSDPDELHLLSKLGSHAATLMIPASTILRKIKNEI